MRLAYAGGMCAAHMRKGRIRMMHGDNGQYLRRIYSPFRCFLTLSNACEKFKKFIEGGRGICGA